MVLPTGSGASRSGVCCFLLVLYGDSASRCVQILKLHVIPGIAPQNLIKHGEKLSTVAGVPVTVVEGGANTKISAGVAVAAVITADVLSCKGVVHIIDTVLVAPKMFVPPTVATSPAAAAPQAVGATEPEPVAPVPAPVSTPPLGRPNHANGVKPGPDGKWSVCAGNYGKLTGESACGVRVSRTGKVTVVRSNSCSNMEA